jgi:large subunit ribosomal protein L29
MKDSFKDLTLKELVTKREDLKKEYQNLRFNIVMGHVDNPLKKRTLGRQIARLNTIIHEYAVGIRMDQGAGE